MFYLSFSVPMETKGCRPFIQVFLTLTFQWFPSSFSFTPLPSPLLKSYTRTLKHLHTFFSSHFCEYLVTLICYCVFFTFLSLYIDFFLFLFCEKPTPVLLLETGNQSVFCHFSLFAECVKLVIVEALYIYLLHWFIA